MITLKELTQKDSENIKLLAKYHEEIELKLKEYRDIIDKEVMDKATANGFDEEAAIDSYMKIYMIKQTYKDLEDWEQSLFLGCVFTTPYLAHILGSDINIDNIKLAIGMCVIGILLLAYTTFSIAVRYKIKKKFREYDLSLHNKNKQ